MQQGMTWWQAMLTILLGNVIVLFADDSQRARRHEIRRLVPRAVPRELRRPRREYPGDPARAGRLRMVRHPDVDRRAGAECAPRRGVARAGPTSRSASGSRSRSSGRFRSGSSSTGSRASRSSKAGRRRCCSAEARCFSGGPSSAAAASVTFCQRVRAAPDRARPVLAAVSRRAHRERRLLGDAQPEHS